ncbi:hypothetical protein [Motilimonas pumila]|uniref:Uncharacterized protein n=1 Tax=Motilimonas pumila TaxID=2303987 RepID=A0A418YDZ0_9GAMM|nr:hypothetical protein [Motilimonas pumila]RJG42773.1 hypothetical protein D1Z90_11835 [Motilimonas pumila]
MDEKLLKRRRVTELQFPSSAYADQSHIKSQVSSMVGRLQSNESKDLAQTFAALNQGPEKVEFLRRNTGLLGELLQRNELQQAAKFITAVCDSKLTSEQGRFGYQGNNQDFCTLAQQLNQLFAQLTQVKGFGRHQHLSIELSGALSALAEELEDQTAKKAVLDILAVMVLRIIK